MVMLKIYLEIMQMTKKRCLHVKSVKVWSKKVIVHAHIVVPFSRMMRKKKPLHPEAHLEVHLEDQEDQVPLAHLVMLLRALTEAHREDQREAVLQEAQRGVVLQEGQREVVHREEQREAVHQVALVKEDLLKADHQEDLREADHQEDLRKVALQKALTEALHVDSQ